MKPSLVDTDTLSFFFKGNTSAVSQFSVYYQQFGTINLSIITYYEILSGLKYKDASNKLNLFLKFAAQNTILPLTNQAVTLAAIHYAKLRKKGRMLDDIDLLIAGISLANDFVLITRNIKHFERIEGLEIADWTR